MKGNRERAWFIYTVPTHRESREGDGGGSVTVEGVWRWSGGGGVTAERLWRCRNSRLTRVYRLHTDLSSLKGVININIPIIIIGRVKTLSVLSVSFIYPSISHSSCPSCPRPLVLKIDFFFLPSSKGSKSAIRSWVLERTISNRKQTQTRTRNKRAR